MTQLFTTRYWGVKIIGGSSPTYTVTYYYNGNPDVGSYENYQDLAKRSDNSTSAWTEADATLNTTTKTLVLTGQTGTEYIDGKEDNSLPVELINFTAEIRNGNVYLDWQTATERDNYGFEVEREKVKTESEWEEIGFVPGYGNSNSPKKYSFVDKNPPDVKVGYRLKQIDMNGGFKYSDIIEINIGAPTKFELLQNYPNPFNPSTTIQYSLPYASKIQLEIFDVLGQRVKVLVDKIEKVGLKRVVWNANNFASGVYFVRIYAVPLSNRFKSFSTVKKMMLLK
jgi:hypothetical protein